MREVCMIGTQVWDTREVAKYPFHHPGHAISRMFYDEKTGEVWGKRLVLYADHNIFHYIARPKESMDLSLSYEWVEAYNAPPPPGVLCALIVAAGNNPHQPTNHC